MKKDSTRTIERPAVPAEEEELLALIDEYDRQGNDQGAARCRQALQALRAMVSGDEERVREAERQLGRRIIGEVVLPPRRPPVGVRPRTRTSSSRPRERRERRSHSRGGDSGGDDDPPGRSAAGSSPRHISSALKRAGFDPFQRPLDRLLAGLRAQASDAYRLEPGKDGRADAWLCRCPLHPDTGFSLTIVDRGDDQEPWMYCVVGCSPRLIEWTLGFHPEHDEKARALAEQLVAYQRWVERRSA
jgi:hypothetical protein